MCVEAITQGLIITNPKTSQRYSLISKLGEGGFGEVWLAYDVSNWHYQIAIKFFQALQESDKQQFLLEYQQSADLNHIDVLPSLFYGEWNNRLFIGMNYCEYGTVAQFVGQLNPAKKSDENLIWNIIYDTASGLEYLHDSRNIVHQDIKPDNIMIKSEGDFVIIDFGISINVNSKFASDNYSDFGSPAYMAPERFYDSHRIIYANDIWSLGVTIYEIAMGELPFNGLGGNYLTPDMPSLAGWSNDLNAVMQSCLCYEPWQRKRASEIKAYAKWILEGKKSPNPWGKYTPNLRYPIGGNQGHGNDDGRNGRPTIRGSKKPNHPNPGRPTSKYDTSIQSGGNSTSPVNGNSSPIDSNNKTRKHNTKKIVIWTLLLALMAALLVALMLTCPT